MPAYLQDPIVWLCFAALLVALEFILISGVGILILAASCLLVAPLLYLGVLHSMQDIWLVLGGSFIVFMFFFLKPLRRLYGKSLPEVKCAIGEKVEVIDGPISKTLAGRIRYSNGEMPAVLSATDSIEQVEVGDLVEVVRIRGNLAQVTIGYQ